MNIDPPATPATGADFDVIVLGGGPTGAAAATALAQHGRRVLVLEKEAFPRFHVGESLLPELNPCFKRLGLTEKLKTVPQVKKTGVEFVFGHEEVGAMLDFKECAHWAEHETFNVERAPFDKVMLDHAESCGAIVKQGVKVTHVPEMRDGLVRVETNMGEFTAQYLFDASGQNCFLGRQLGIRKTIPGHRKTAFMGHFTNVKRLPGEAAGYPTMVMCDEGWFWVIHIDDTRTSIGMVMDVEAVKQLPVKPDQCLVWAVKNCPHLAARTKESTFPEKNGSVSDYSYKCDHYAGPGYFLLGDAAIFLDPIFSSGIYLGVSGAIDAADWVNDILNGKQTPAQVRRRYEASVTAKSAPFFKLVTAYYTHSFRELFREGRGPHGVHKALLSILTGRVENVPFSIRWRIRYFDVALWVHRHLKRIAPTRATFSILKQAQVAGHVVHSAG